MKTVKNVILVALLASVLSVKVQANVSYPNLHQKETAKASYEGFKSGTSEDPFDSLLNDYSESYLTEVNTVVNPAQIALVQEKSVQQFQSNQSYFEGLDSTKSDIKHDIYKDSFSESGEFDAEAYASNYSSYISSQRESSNSQLQEGFNNLVTIMENKNSALQDLSTSIEVLTSQATVNLVDLLNSNKYEMKSNLFNGYSSSVANANTTGQSAQNSLVLAQTYADGCGNACDFPDVIPPVASDIPPVEPDPIDIYYVTLPVYKCEMGLTSHTKYTYDSNGNVASITYYECI